MTSLRPVALITGGSSGIGAALARVFARHGHEVVLVARNEDALRTVADEIGASGGIRPHVIALDLARMDAGARIGHELVARGLEPAFVVNNAGFGLSGAADRLDRAEQLSMIDINVRALTDLSLRWVDVLARRNGGVLNVASVAGFLSGPGMAVYYATKAYVLSFSEALERELQPQGVKVCVLCPGPVATGFQRRAGIRLRHRRLAQLFAQSAERVAEEGYAGLVGGKRLVVPGIANRLVTLMPRVLPRATLLKLTDSRGPRDIVVGPRWPTPR